jgi:thymidylate kinase
MKGQLIVFEGLDCSGKTTAIKNILNLSDKFVYNKGIGSDTFIGRTSRKLPSTFSFIVELIYGTIKKIIPNLRKGKIVLQDRYDISISSFVPQTCRWCSRILIFVSKLLIPEPNRIIYFHLPLEERIKRLKEKGTKYELMLAQNPSLIVLREGKYSEWFDKFHGEKIKIDTAKNNIQETSEVLGSFIFSK